MLWSYGITTVPSRRSDLLPTTLQSLREGGFSEPRLFVDGCSLAEGEAYARDLGLEVSPRAPALRAFSNWYLALMELYVRSPHADRYAIFQDDLVTYRNLRSYLDRCPFPEKGYWNLYTFRDNEHIIEGQAEGSWHEATLLRSGPRDSEGKFYYQTGRGAVGLVFNREGVITLLSSRHMLLRPQDSKRGYKLIDGGVVTAMNKEGWREYVHCPTLLGHRGALSAVKPGKYSLPEKTFRGESHDALSFLPGGEGV